MECNICFNLYDLKNCAFYPLILDCGHTFCKSCIRNLLQKNPQCPYDRTKILKNLDQIKVNYALLDAITKIPCSQPNKNSNIFSEDPQNSLKKQQLLQEISDLLNKNAKVSALLRTHGLLFEKLQKDHKIDKSSIQGPIKSSTGQIFMGEIDSSGKKQGLGMQIWQDGSIYEGFFYNDKPHKYGRSIDLLGNMYVGEWLNGTFCGKGSYFSNNKENPLEPCEISRDIEKNAKEFHNKKESTTIFQCISSFYEGEWRDNKRHGYGKDIWSDGSQYEGFFHEGKKQGKGKMEWNDGSRYVGEFVNDKIHGFGEYSWKDGRVYFGEWRDNHMNGKGLFTWEDGKSYEGDYLQDLKHGYGVFQWSNGEKYMGMWKQGKQEGLGRFFNENGEEKKGEWVDGKLIKWLE